MTALHPPATSPTLPQLGTHLPDREALRLSPHVRPDAVALLSLGLVDLILAGGGLALLSVLGITLSHTLSSAVPVLWVAILAATQGYSGRRVPHGLRETTSRALRAGACLTIACVVLATLVGVHPRPSVFLLVATVLTGGSLAPRLGMEVLSRRERGPARRTRVIVAGHHPREVARVVTELRSHSEHSFDVVMVCLARSPKRWTYDVPVAVGLDQVGDRVGEVGADALLVLPCRHVDGEVLRRLGWQLEAASTALYVGTPLLDVAPARTTMAHAGGLGLLHVRPSRHRGPARMLKGVLERLGALVLLLLLAPLLLALACAVRVDSPGPSTYRQTRIGRSGTPFTMYKFRTMCAGADRLLPALAEQNVAAGVLFKVREDPRLTRLGGVLRRYSLDELPQLFNVLLGQMSLVGPRPALPDEVAQYAPDVRRRLAVKPGLTGLWQISGRSDLSWSESVRLDLRYVDNWSLGLDLLILCRTAGAVLDHRGAY